MHDEPPNPAVPLLTPDTGQTEEGLRIHLSPSSQYVTQPKAESLYSEMLFDLFEELECLSL